MARGGESHRLALYNVETGRRVWSSPPWQRGPQRAVAYAISAGGSRVALVRVDGTVEIWNVAENRRVVSLLFWRPDVWLAYTDEAIMGSGDALGWVDVYAIKETASAEALTSAEVQRRISSESVTAVMRKATK